MSKVVKTVGKVAGVVAGVALVASGIGAALGGTMLFTAFGASIAASTIATVAGAVAAGASLLMGKPKGGVPEQALNRLNATFETNAPRKVVFGTTAFATDLRYQSYTGADQEYLNWVLGCANHKVASIDQLWFDNELAWSASGGVRG